MDNNNLNTAEYSNLWLAYYNNSMVECLITYFEKSTSSSSLKEILQETFTLSNYIKDTIIFLLKSNKQSKPIGFDLKEHVYQSDSVLFKDELIIECMKRISSAGLPIFSESYVRAINKEIRDFFLECHNQTAKIDNLINNLLKEKGMMQNQSLLIQNNNNKFIENKSFNNILSLHKRSLTVTEVNWITVNTACNNVGVALLTGFAQVASKKSIKKYFIKARDVGKNHINILNGKLEENNLPVISGLETYVTDTLTAPFSEKLMLAFSTYLNTLGNSNYGSGLALSGRKDLSLMYMNLITDVGSLTKDGLDLLIEYGWAEEPPLILDRDYLIKK